MQKVVFYAMRGEKMCFLHILMNALAMFEKGLDVAIIIEGESVRLVSEMQGHLLMESAREKKLIAGVCMGCSQQLGVLEANRRSGLPLLSDLNGHADLSAYVAEGYDVISI